MQAVDRRLTGFAGVMALCLAVSGCVSASLDDSQVDDSQPDDSQLDDSQSATDYVASRGPGGVNPDLNGIWQALNEANYDIERHLARASMGVRDGPHGPVPDLKTLYIGAVASVPPSLSAVRRGKARFPYTAGSRILTRISRKLRHPVATGPSGPPKVQNASDLPVVRRAPNLSIRRQAIFLSLQVPWQRLRGRATFEASVTGTGFPCARSSMRRIRGPAARPENLCVMVVSISTRWMEADSPLLEKTDTGD